MAEKVGLLGWPVTHSISPAMQNAAFEALGLDWRYDLLPVEPGTFEARLGELIAAGYRGFNVTVPHKQSAMRAPQVTELDSVAAEIGAANTLTLLPGGGLRASNTDWRGFADDLSAHDMAIGGRDCIILGTGGSSRGVAYALRQCGAAHIRWVSRAPDGRPDVIDYEGLRDAVPAGERLLIINCTPVGMHPQKDVSPWPEGLEFPSHASLVDLIYNPPRTRLMLLADAAGAQVIGGLGMLVRQGALAFETWTGITPPIEVMANAARQALGLRESIS